MTHQILAEGTVSEESMRVYSLVGTEEQHSNTDLSIPGRLMLPDIENNSRAVRIWMTGNAMHSTAQNVESSFRYHAFFASSALGVNPFKLDSNGAPSRDISTGATILKGPPSPLRVLDPLLWILWQHGKLGGLDKIPNRMNGGVA